MLRIDNKTKKVLTTFQQSFACPAINNLKYVYVSTDFLRNTSLVLIC